LTNPTKIEWYVAIFIVLTFTVVYILGNYQKCWQFDGTNFKRVDSKYCVEKVERMEKDKKKGGKGRKGGY